MEFGARALGNRASLADPRDFRGVARINKMIKSRDFWMPFAPTVRAGGAARYLRQPEGGALSSPFMMLAFDTPAEGREALAAAVRPYAATARPQLLREEDNPASARRQPQHGWRRYRHRACPQAG